MAVKIDVISPSQAVDMLLKSGIAVSERALREKARKIGAYREIGRSLFFTQDDIAKIMEPEPCSHSSSAKDHLTGSRGEQLKVGASKKAHDAVTKMKPRKSPTKSSNAKPAMTLVHKA